MKIESMHQNDWSAVAAIYREGIETGHATFAAEPPDSFAEYCDGKLMECAVVARDDGQKILGWAALTKVSDRCVYAGVAEVSVYVAEAARGRGVGGSLMQELIARSEAAGIWTLQAGIFPQNLPSIALHERHGFRVLGRRERVGKMTFGALAGQWRDTFLFERRSTVAGV
jgi:L-amino acid N-acyltransferase YncA